MELGSVAEITEMHRISFALIVRFMRRVVVLQQDLEVVLRDLYIEFLQADQPWTVRLAMIII